MHNKVTMEKLMTMLEKMYNRYITTSVNPLDLIVSKLKSKGSKKIKVGWCSIFPPASNGVAAANYFLLNKFLERNEIEFYAIPFGGRIDKKLFPSIRFARIGSLYLDVVVFFDIGIYLKNIMKKAKTKTIVWQTLHHPLSGGGLHNDHIELKVLKDSKKADLLIGPSRWSVREYKKHGAKNVAYVPLTVDTAFFKQRKVKEQKNSNSNFTVLFVSRVNYYKGIMPFLDTIPIVLKKYPHVIFKLHSPIDMNSYNLDEITNTIAKIKKEYPKNFLTVTEWIDYTRMNEVYDNVDVLVFPSCSEGFGIPLIEAMSNGIPCIVADSPPMDEIVRNNKTGFCIKYKKCTEKKYHGFKFPHPKDIAEKIIFLIENKKMLDSLKKNCRPYVKKNYEMQQGVDEFIANIKEVVREKN